MTMFHHPRHAHRDLTNVLHISIENLAKLYHCYDRIDDIFQRFVVISCLDNRYSEELIFGDYVDFDDRDVAYYQRKQKYGGFYSAVDRLLSYGKAVFVIMPQPRPLKFDPGPRFCYIEFPEFYGIYHDLFLSHYGTPSSQSRSIYTRGSMNSDTGSDFRYHYLFLNKRNRMSRQQLFCQLLDQDVLQYGLVSFLGHSIEHEYFDQSLWDLNHQKLSRWATKFFSVSSGERARNMVPYQPDPRMEITDRLCGTGGWLPELNLYRDTFIDVVFETHDNLNGPTVFTEKIFRSIYLGRPFVAMGGQNFLVELRKLGFETFDRWIDETYDLDQNPLSRTEMIGNVLVDLCKESIESLKKLRQEMMPVIVHNQQRLRQLSQDLRTRLGQIDSFLLRKFNN